MKRYILSLLLLLTVLTAFCGCSTAPVIKNADMQNTNTNEEAITPVSDAHNYVVEAKEGELLAPDGTVLATYSYAYPVFEANEGDDAKYIAEINEMFKENALDIVNEAKQDYDSALDAYESDWLVSHFSYTYDFGIHTDAKGIISITEIWHYYTGGAHGGTLKASHTFDAVNGKELSLSDLLYGTDEEITQAFTQEFLKVSDMFYPDTDPAEVVPEELPDAQYYVDTEGVTAYFQEYQVGPYAVGFVSATISDKEMLRYDFS